MGWISKHEIQKGLDGALRFFRDYISKIDIMSECEVYTLIMVLGVYLYSKYCKISCKRKGDSYWVNSDTMYLVYSDTSIASIAVDIVLTRNKIAHVPFTDDTDKDVNAIIESVNFKKLLIFEGIIDSSGRFIEPESGMYNLVDSINNNNTNTEEIKPDFMKALSKMSGE